MKTLGRAALLSLLVVGLVPLVGAGQGYEPPSRANPKDVYCSGFVASSPLPANLRIVMAEDAVGGVTYSQYDYIYLSHGANGGVSVGQRYSVVRPVNDPNPIQAFDGQNAIWKTLGQHYMDLGWVEVTGVHPTTATALVQLACDALRAGDVLVPFRERPAPVFKASETFDRFASISSRGEATIIWGKEFQVMVGQGDVMYVNLGTGQGVKVGDYYRIYRYGSGTIYKGYKGMGRGLLRHERGMPYGYNIPKMRRDLPREVLGEALVVHADQSSSTAVVTLSLGEIHAGDFVELEPPAAPKASLSASPASIPRGASTRLSWRTEGAQEVEISPGVGSVDTRGSAEISPTQTTTYMVSARGLGGSAEATATVTVVQPEVSRPAPAPTPTRGPSVQEVFAQSVQDAYFAFNRAEITPEAAGILQRAAEFLKAYPQARVLIEGHCDEIGGDQYNIELGARRAEAVRNYLVSLGVNAAQLETTSLGKQSPFCTESSEESCRRLNRRAHFVLQ